MNTSKVITLLVSFISPPFLCNPEPQAQGMVLLSIGRFCYINKLMIIFLETCLQAN